MTGRASPGSVPRLVTAFAVACFVLASALLVLQGPGLEYDEALMVHGAIHMLEGDGPPPFPHDRGSWVRAGGSWWPLMVIPYVGALRHYLAVPVFSIWGPDLVAIRLQAALLAALGLWGVFSAARRLQDEWVAAWTVVLLALNPALVWHCVFDSTGAALLVLATGLFAGALSRYLAGPARTTAFVLGLAAGFGIWARLNFLWLLGALAVAGLLVLRARLFPPPTHLALMAAGGALGAAPVIAYQLLSRFATLGFMQRAGTSVLSAETVRARLEMLGVAMLTGQERPDMWGGAAAPAWQWVPLAVFVAASLAVLPWLAGAPRIRQDGQRVAAWGSLLLLAVILTSRLGVREYHLMMATPLLAFVAACAGVRLFRSGLAGRALAGGLLAFYLVLSAGSQAGAVRSLRATGGVGRWSDGVARVAEDLLAHDRGSEVRVLTWGLGNNLYVLTGGRIRLREPFWTIGADPEGIGRQWAESGGGAAFVLPAVDSELFAIISEDQGAAVRSFRKRVLSSARRPPTTTVLSRQGQRFAEVVRLPAEGLGQEEVAPPVEPPPPASLSAAPNPACEPDGLAVMRISWQVPRGLKTEVRVGSPGGTLFASTTGPGSWTTGEWVSDGMVLWLVDPSTKDPGGSPRALASVRLRVQRSGCSPSGVP